MLNILAILYISHGMMLLIVMQKSLFIAYLNKMMANYSSLQLTVLTNLLTSYCCSFYGLHLWKFNLDFEKCKIGILLFVNCCNFTIFVSYWMISIQIIIF